MESTTEFRRTVLVVDDEAVNREMLGTILSQDYNVIHAENGTEALAKLQSLRERISLVLLDLLMPEVDGYAVLESVKSDSELSKIPIIVLTSEKSAEVKSLQMGAADFLTKPYDMPEVILARVRRSIELAEDAHIIQSTEKDILTGLYTKEFFFEYARQLIKRNPDTVMDALVINLSGFHMLNELYGRTFGNTVLQTIAADILQLAKEAGGIGCRYNADGFYLYMAHHWNYDKPLERIKFHLSELLKETEIHVRMGVCQGTYRASSLEERFDCALYACNSLREHFGSAYAVYGDEMRNQEIKKARILGDFAEAVEQKQFKVLYQPKYNIQGKFPVLSSLEALVSWNHPEFGMMKPDSFIPQFEKNGLIQRLDRYVWKEACEQMRRWKEETGSTVPVSVNVSRVDLHDPKIVDYLLQITKENGIPTDQFLLEITESAYIEESSVISESVKKLRAAGFKIEMDDFGSGYSSLNLLATLPIDALKLDIGFIKNIARDKKSYYLVQVVLTVARQFKIPCVAEGVETKEQLELLQKAGCEIVQGFYFSKAISPEEVTVLRKTGIKF